MRSRDLSVWASRRGLNPPLLIFKWIQPSLRVTLYCGAELWWTEKHTGPCTGVCNRQVGTNTFRCPSYEWWDLSGHWAARGGRSTVQEENLGISRLFTCSTSAFMLFFAIFKSYLQVWPTNQSFKECLALSGQSGCFMSSKFHQTIQNWVCFISFRSLLGCSYLHGH